MTREDNPCSRRQILRTIGLTSMIGGMAWADEPEKSVPEQIVDTMSALFGKHPGAGNHVCDQACERQRCGPA